MRLQRAFLDVTSKARTETTTQSVLCARRCHFDFTTSSCCIVSRLVVLFFGLYPNRHHRQHSRHCSCRVSPLWQRSSVTQGWYCAAGVRTSVSRVSSPATGSPLCLGLPRRCRDVSPLTQVRRPHKGLSHSAGNAPTACFPFPTHSSHAPSNPPIYPHHTLTFTPQASLLRPSAPSRSPSTR